MNLPGRLGGNWKWRYRAEALTPAIARRLETLTRTFGRRPPPSEARVDA
jgi:4-alpha-glucanotransferase